MRTLNVNAGVMSFFKILCLSFLLVQCFSISLSAQAIKRTGDSANQAGAIQGNAMIEVDGKIVTAVKTNNSGILRLISWRKNSNGSLSRSGDSGNQAGKIGKISATAFFGGNKLATAVMNSSGNLKIILWRINGNGSFTRLGDSANQAGKVSSLSIVALSNDMLLTAVRDSNGFVKVISWRVNGNNIARLNDLRIKKGTWVKLTRLEAMSGNVQAVCAFKGDTGNLTLASLKVYPNGLIKCLKFGYAGQVKALAIDAIRDTKVMTAVKDSGNKLKMIAWQLSGSGDFYRRGDASAGVIGGLSLKKISSSNSGGYLMTAVSTSSGALRLIAWKTNSNASTVTRIGDSGSQAGASSMIRLTGRSSSNITTAVRTSGGKLKLISWKQN